MNDISFTSRINFVNRKAFDSFRKGVFVDFRPNNELTSLDLKMLNSKNMPHPRLDVIKGDEIFMEEVRTCTGVITADTKNGETAASHVYDSLDNLEHTNDILDDIFALVPNPDHAFIIGSKNLKMSIYSAPIFQKLLDGISKRVKNVTIFREHILPFSESNFHYSAKNDTLTIQTMGRPLTDYREFDVTSRDLLDKSFKEIKLADGDILEFNTNG